MARRTDPPRRTAEPIPPPRTKQVAKVPPKGRGKGSVQSGESLERDAEMMRLRSLGWTYQQIAAHMGIGHATAYEGVQRHVSRTVDEPARVVREQVLARLDAATNAAMVVLGSVHFVFHQGEQLTMVDKETGETLAVKDHKPVLDAALAVAKLDERRCKLLGIDAPERQEVSLTQIPAWVETYVQARKAAALEQGPLP